VIAGSANIIDTFAAGTRYAYNQGSVFLAAMLLPVLPC
jgi:hypothetical protein